MDINDFRGLVTAATLVGFVGVWIWAWSHKRKAEFEQSASLPLEDDRAPSGSNEEKN